MAGTPPLPPASPAVACPKCGAAAPAGARFCNACGSSLFVQSGSSTGTSAPPAAPPVDIRQTVDQDRGVLKRLQLLVPGFRGYREGEDIRAADSLLRRQVADKVKSARTTMENSRAALTNAKQFAALNDLAPLIADLMRLEGQIRFAEQGYTGISPAVRANPPQLDRLYEYRLRLRHGRRPVEHNGRPAARRRDGLGREPVPGSCDRLDRARTGEPAGFCVQGPPPVRGRGPRFVSR